MTTPLLPERHPVRDFFVLDTIDVVPRGDMASMEHPIFSLSTKPETRRLSYHHNDVRLEIIPSTLGLPTVFDKDILIYCISKLIHLKNAGEAIGPRVRLTTHDMLVQTNRPTNNLGYERLLPALNRLRGVVINTTIATGKEQTTRGFGLIDEFEYNRRGSMFAERLKYLEVKLSDWLFRAIEAAEVLPISRDYFRLRRPIDRRIYELARKHCGRQPSWRIGFDTLQKKAGSKQQEKHFSAHLRALARSNHLPDYALTLESGHAVFYRCAADDRAAPPAPRAEFASAVRAPTHETRAIRVTNRAIEDLADIAPGWDRYHLESLYLAWAADKDAARSEDARFLGWARKYTKGRRP
jgi:plasmid replication initiation protein